MDFNSLVTAIGSLGFPIIMCLLMYDRMGKQDAQHKEEMMKLTESLNNNTLAISKLTDKIQEVRTHDATGSNG